MNLYRAWLETPHFYFEAYGYSADDSARYLLDGLKEHGRQRLLPKSWYFPILQDARVELLRVAAPTRDGHYLDGSFPPDADGRILRSGRVVWIGGAE